MTGGGAEAFAALFAGALVVVVGPDGIVRVREGPASAEVAGAGFAERDDGVIDLVLVRGEFSVEGFSKRA